MSEVPAVLAIDGGNSKTDVALLDRAGSVLAGVRGVGASAFGGTRIPAAELERLVGQAAWQAGQQAEPPFAEHASVFLAGLDLPEEETEFHAELEARDWSPSLHIGNDILALLRSGTKAGGSAVVCGAGINAVGLAPDGRVHRFAALGQISGDWGGGRQLGSEALWHAARAEDGRGPDTALRAAVCARFGLPDIAAVTAAFHRGQLDSGATHQLSPVLLKTAEAGDRVANTVLDRLVEEIVLMATVPLRALGLLDEAVDIVLGGSVMTALPEYARHALAEGCRTHAPKAGITIPDIPPIAGAALLGFDQLMLSERHESAIYAGFRDWHPTSSG